MTTQPLRVAVVGRTGRGDWGHAIDELWTAVEGTELVAVADESADGLGKAVERLGRAAGSPPSGFRDWRAMLAEVKPEIVSLCMRHIDCHAEMAIAAGDGTAHCECLGPLLGEREGDGQQGQRGRGQHRGEDALQGAGFQHVGLVAEQL